MLLSLSTWPEVQSYLTRSKGVIIPVGSTEQHGPMGHIGTDAICPTIIAQKLSDQYDILVAPTINYGMSQHHMAFTGSITLRPSSFINVIKDVVYSFNVHGFTHLFFLNGHGGNCEPLSTAFSEIYCDFSLKAIPCPIYCRQEEWYELKRVRELNEKYFKDIAGDHASPDELSLCFHAYPDHQKSAVLEPQVPPNGDFRDAADFRENFSDGRMGADSSKATQQIGAEMCEAAVKDMIEIYTSFLATS